jgi:phosphoribosylaminoimidazolecarboxamide formyltransferase/IMP cyclohydrolase
MSKLALLSVTDKTGIAEFAKGLMERGFEILSTGGTAATLREKGIEVTSVSDYTGQPEILGGRVKTLHPRIHAGILALEEHAAEMEKHDIRPIDVVAVNLYPFEKTVLSGARPDEIIENIDIGGPAMIRAAAKNATSVYVVTDPEDYPEVLREISAETAGFRKRLQAKAFAHTAFYDGLIAEHLAPSLADGKTLTIPLRLKQRLRYGENPHQSGALYIRPFEVGGIANSKQVSGKELSYNNLLDADAAWELACDLAREARSCVIVKHGNPCGASWGPFPADCFRKAKEGDPISAFGGIVALPGNVDEATAAAISEKGNFFEVLLCSTIDEDALQILSERSGWGSDLRILQVPDGRNEYFSVRTVRGGALVQEADITDPAEWSCATTKEPSPAEENALRHAWTVARHVKSNAIVIANSERVLGVGAGQMNRVQSVRLAIEAAGDAVAGAVLASDAFFPFPDSIETAAEAGISAVVQPGGSKKDKEVVATADRLGLAMMLTGVRHFRH